MFITCCPKLNPPLPGNNLFNVGFITGNNAHKMLEWSNTDLPLDKAIIKLENVPVCCVEGNDWRHLEGVTWRKATISLMFFDNWKTNNPNIQVMAIAPGVPQYTKHVLMTVDPSETFNCHSFTNTLQPILVSKGVADYLREQKCRMYAGWLQLTPVLDFLNIMRATWRSNDASVDTNSSPSTSSNGSLFYTCQSTTPSRMYKAPSLTDLNLDPPVATAPVMQPKRAIRAPLIAVRAMASADAMATEPVTQAKTVTRVLAIARSLARGRT